MLLPLDQPYKMTALVFLKVVIFSSCQTKAAPLRVRMIAAQLGRWFLMKFAIPRNAYTLERFVRGLILKIASTQLCNGLQSVGPSFVPRNFKLL